ncbi:DUF6144 family protein [Anaerosporobacter faecicola]|uniref:DUF6144 family protein n=1 Tax=Anaerosporobacter faecicola TaxID=2718714 RepID=UPI00143A01E9|nr:DUF6144 family protein [Anaerosporobacter faecicola]
MGKNENANVRRMVTSMEKVIGEKEARKFEEEYPLSNSATTYNWVKNVCEYLEKNYDQKTLQCIREGCICNDGKSTAKKMNTYRNKTMSVEEFIQLFNEKESFASMEYINEQELLFCYPECYCSLVNKTEQPVSKTWCYCTVGYAKSLFTQVFGENVEVSLEESIKNGDTRCAVRVTW